uniref:Uncharacterized protein n=1 Tax=Candidatus Kentrum sp. TUN TaxID=2126343 RepID=A0A450ZGW6_9GAMM|nr:MAG: hypothetical protein BECKTUN1418F_GA0071002_101531 [Candidatus Kentron sp. TUN]VFK53522.1 MAG: hypothetical protein BECKTUN1418E_GA0071001_101732 [Candidatus Kentron sp. TUN]
MALGGKVDFAWEFFKLDAFGAFAILACFVSYTYEWSNKDLFLGISAMIAGAYVFSSFVTFKEEFFFLLRNSLPKGNRR